MVSLSSSRESHSFGSSIETGKLVVSQPAKLKEVTDLLLTIDALPQRIAERMGEDRSGDLGGSGAGAGISDDGTTPSPRDIAIAAIPSPTIIQRKLEGHIRTEIKQLQKQATRLRRLARPGAAWRLNELYAKIRRLNALLAQLVEMSVDVLRRLFARVFIDRQPIL